MKTKLEEIAEKLEKRESEIDIKLQVANAMLPLKDVLQDKIQSQIVGNNSLIVKEVCDSIKQSIENQSFSQIIEAIESQTQALSDDTGKQVLSELKIMIEQLQKLEQKNYFDQNSFNNIFTTSFNRVVTILQNQERLAYQTVYNRNSSGQISTVTEYFEGYTVKNTWTYDSNGRLSKVITEKNETE